MQIGCDREVEEHQEEGNAPRPGPGKRLEDSGPLPLRHRQRTPRETQGKLAPCPLDRDPKGGKTDHCEEPLPESSLCGLGNQLSGQEKPRKIIERQEKSRGQHTGKCYVPDPPDQGQVVEYAS